MQTTSVVDPVGDECTDGVERLPECHDETSDLWWSHLADVDRASSYKRRQHRNGNHTGAFFEIRTQSHSLAETDEETAGHEAGKIALSGEGLHHSRSNSDQAAKTHAHPTTKKVGLDSVMSDWQHGE